MKLSCETQINAKMCVFLESACLPASRMMYGSEESPPGRGQVGCHGRDGQLGLVGTWRVSELDCDRLRGALWYCAVQLFNSHFGFVSLVEPDETDSLGKTCR